jgi:hypothetical protein
MTPGKPKINAPGQKMAQAQETRINVRPGFSGIMAPIAVDKKTFRHTAFF